MYQNVMYSLQFGYAFRLYVKTKGTSELQGVTVTIKIQLTVHSKQ